MSPRRLVSYCCLFAIGILALPQVAPGYALNGYTWPDGTQIVMHLGLTHTPSSFPDGAGSWNGSATDALSTWNQYIATVQFAAGSAISPAPQDGENSAFFSNTVYGQAWGTGVLAITLRISSQGTNFTETDVIFNNKLKWSSYRGPLIGSGPSGTYDFHRVALHEFGHVLGLDHPDQYGQSVEAIMNSVISDLDHLADDDIAGVRSLYGFKITSSLSPTMVNSGDLFNYQIRANNNPTSFTAAGLPPGLQFDSNTGLISGRCPGSGTFLVDISAQSASGTATGGIPIIVSPLHLTSNSYMEVGVGGNLSYQITATNNPTSYSAPGLPPGVTLNATTGLISGTANTSGLYYVTVKANSSTAEAQGVVQFSFRPPQITSQTHSGAISIGTNYTYQITATNQPTSFDATNLPSWLQIDHTTGLLSGQALTTGAFYITIIAHTSYGDATAVVYLYVNPPTITSSEWQYGEIGQSLSYQITSTNNPTSFSANGLPPGLTLDAATGFINGIVSTAGNYSVTIIAHTSYGDAQVQMEIIIQSPRLTSNNYLYADIGKPFSLQITASNQPISFSSSSLPAGLHLDPVTGLLSGVPELSGSYQFQVTAPGIGGNAVGTITLFVTPAYTPTIPTATIPLTLTGAVVADPKRPRIYAATAGGIGVIDVATLSVIQTVPMSSMASVDLSISADGNKLWITGSAVYAIRSIDLNSLTPLPSLTTTIRPTRLHEAADGRLYVTSDPPGVFQLDATSGAILNQFGPSHSGLYNFCNLGISPDRKTLYVTEVNGLSLSRYDLTVPGIPPLIQRIDETGYGYAGPIAINPHGQTAAIFTFADIGRAPNPTHVRSASDLAQTLASFTLPGYPGPLSYSADGAILFDGIMDSPSIEVYDTASYALLRTISLPDWANVNAFGQTQAMAVDKNNTYLFAAGFIDSGSSKSIALYVYPVIPPQGPPSLPHSLLNVSTRLRTQTGDNVLIGGFIISGTEPKKVILRATGPSLPVPGNLADPTLELHNPDGSVITNDNWNAHRADVIASGFAPADEHEAAIVTSLQPGVYTAILRGLNDTSGVALVEVYDLSPNSNSKITNISTRGKVESNDNVMIAGFIIGGDQPTKVIVRALGPSLAGSNVPGVLNDTTLELHDSNGAPIAFNDDWQSDQAQEINNTNKAPPDPREAALVRTLQPGVYTAIVRGKSNATGVALVEVYNLDAN